MGGSCIQEPGRILRCDAASCLKASRKCPKGFHGLLPRLLIKGRAFRIQQYHMSPIQPVLPIKPCIIIRVPGRHKILTGPVSLVPKACAYNLFYPSVMNINAGSKFHSLTLSETYFMGSRQVGHWHNAPFVRQLIV